MLNSPKISSARASIQNRYMTANPIVINTVSGYNLSLTQSSNGGHFSTGQMAGNAAARFGVEVYTVTSNGVQTEIGGSPDTPVAQVTIGASTTGNQTLTGNWTCPRTNVAETTCVIITVDWWVSVAGWNLGQTFITERLGATQLSNVAWSFGYHVGRAFNNGKTQGFYYYGASDTKSNLTTFQWTSAPTPPQNSRFLASPWHYPSGFAGKAQNFSVYWTAISGNMKCYVTSTNNTGHWSNSTIQLFPDNTETYNLTFSVILNSTGHLYIGLKVYANNTVSPTWNATSTLTFWIWGSSTPAGITNELFNKLGQAQVNSSFPFAYDGSDYYNHGVTSAELITEAVGYLQTGNTTQLGLAESVANWLNQTSLKKQLWFSYNVTSQQWATTAASDVASKRVTELGLLAYVSNKWKPLLQTMANLFIKDFIPPGTNRIYHNLFYSNDSISDDICYADLQSTAIEALAYCSTILNNATIKNIAYKMIMNYTLTSKNLPYAAITQTGGCASGFNYAKEDEGFGNILLAEEAFSYYYPTNSSVNNRIYAIASASDFLWNSTFQFWNYRTNSTTGVAVPGYCWPVHGFGLTDEAILWAGLYFTDNSTTQLWRERAINDWVTNIYCPTGYYRMVQLGMIVHAPTGANIPNPEANDQWNILNRRFGIILYDYTGNASYLKATDFLWANFTRWSIRPCGMQQSLTTTNNPPNETGLVVGEANVREPMDVMDLYNNVTSTITSANQIFDMFGIGNYYLPNIPRAAATETTNAAKGYIGKICVSWSSALAISRFVYRTNNTGQWSTPVYGSISGTSTMLWSNITLTFNSTASHISYWIATNNTANIWGNTTTQTVVLASLTKSYIASIAGAHLSGSPWQISELPTYLIPSFLIVTTLSVTILFGRKWKEDT
jgi:hypothetical protein